MYLKEHIYNLLHLQIMVHEYMMVYSRRVYFLWNQKSTFEILVFLRYLLVFNSIRTIKSLRTILNILEEYQSSEKIFLSFSFQTYEKTYFPTTEFFINWMHIGRVQKYCLWNNLTISYSFSLYVSSKYLISGQCSSKEIYVDCK